MTAREIYRRPTVIAGVTPALIMAVTGIFAPVLAPHDLYATNESAILCPPFSCEQGGPSHVLGTDHLGRDVLSRIVTSFRTNLYIGLLGTFLGTLAALLLVIARSVGKGSTAPETPRPLFRVPLWGLAIFTYCIAFLPSLLIVAAMGPSLVLVIVCVGVFASVLPMTLLYDSVWNNEIAAGTITSPGSHSIHENGSSRGPVQLATRRGIGLIPVGFSLALLIGLFIEFYLSFLGVGVPPPMPSLGSITAAALSQVAARWWMVAFPCGVGLMAAGAFAGIVFPVSRVLSSPAGATRSDALSDLGVTPAGFGIRFAAQLIDLAIAFAAVIIHTVFTAVIELPPAIANTFAIALIIIIVITFVISPGKRAIGLSVLRLDGSPAGWGRKILRYLVSLCTLFVIDLLMIALRKDRRTLADFALGTIVVRRRDTNRPASPDNGVEI